MIEEAKKLRLLNIGNVLNEIIRDVVRENKVKQKKLDNKYLKCLIDSRLYLILEDY
jgi:hypothetical protein